MASFYGNIKNNSRSSFIFDRIYSSRCEMEKALYETVDSNGAIAGDGVFINRYVLINYGYSAEGYYTVVDNAIVAAAAGSSKNSEAFGTYYRKIDGDSNYYPANYNLNTKAYDIEYNPSVIYYKKTNFVERFAINLEEEANYAKNRKADAEKYYANFDHTVWQKIYSDNQEKYILVAELNPEAPTYELIVDAPGTMDGAPHFDLSLSTELNYVYHVPKTWNIVLNEYNPNEDYSDDSINTYWYYENDLSNDNKTFKIKEEYPFINKQGFDKTTRIIKPIQEEGIKLIDTKSIMEYIIHQYRITPLTVDTYTKNRYYIMSTEISPELIDNPNNHIFDINNTYFIAQKADPTYYITCPLVKNEDETAYIPMLELDSLKNEAYWYTNDIDKVFILSLEDFDSTEKYYELTTVVDSEGNRLRKHEKDTKRLDIFLPSIGNAIATIYDAIYGRPRYASRCIIGYTNKDNFNYEQSDFGAYEIQSSQYTLTTEEVNSLRIPVYMKETGDLRGYITYEELEKFETNSSGPYMILGQIYNIKPVYENDDISFESKDNVWDIPVYELIDNIIGYTSEATMIPYTQNDDGQYIINNIYYDLTDDDISELSPELIPGVYDIPVYARENINARPYDDGKLFGTFAPPYDNITEEDNVSMGWALDTLKKYISELRYLANGQNGSLENGLGLQSDWTLDDDQSFGYIYHKPDIITTFIPSSDETFVSNKIYYMKKIDNDPYSDNFGYEYYEEVPLDIAVSEEDTPSLLGYYEIPKTMAKNAETEFYREESVVGFVSSSDIRLFEKLEVDENKYLQKTSDTDNPEIIYYKKDGDSFIVAEEIETNVNYYIEVIDKDRVFIINNQYYYITNAQVNDLQKYSDSKKIYEVTKLPEQVNFIPTESYFVKSGSRYVPAYKTTGTYSFQPITQEQYGEKCLCYFDKFQEITVENQEIVKRKYRFNSYGDANNIYLTTGEFDSNTDFWNKRISKFYITINGNAELELTDDLIIVDIENMTRQQLVEYLLDNELEHVDLPSASFEIIEVFNEEYQIYKNRNNNAFDFNQYVVSIKQDYFTEDDEEYWERNRNKGVIYYLRDYKPITQIDYEINTIWNSIKVDD